MIDVGAARRIAIVGSRRRTARGAVFDLVAALPADAVVISGGAAGVDADAADAARARGLALVEHRPDLAGAGPRFARTRRYYARNQAIVDDADLVIAFPAPDRKGGTEDTIRRAAAAGRRVVLL